MFFPEKLAKKCENHEVHILHKKCVNHKNEMHFVTKGSLQIEFLEKFGILAQLRGGGGLPIPNFYPIFPEQTLLC